MILQRSIDTREAKWSPKLFLYLSAALITLCFNRQALGFIFHQDSAPYISNTLFNISAVILIFVIVLLTLLPFFLLNLHKVAVFFFIFISASASYFSDKYGIIFEETVIKSVFETTYGEATQYLNIHLVFWNVFFLILSAAFVFFIQIEKKSLYRRAIECTKIFSFALIVLLVLATLFYKDYASFLRNNRQVRHLINPVSPLVQTVKYWKNRNFPKTDAFVAIGGDAQLKKFRGKKKKLVVFVLGETARSDHFSLNGYKRNPTTPELERLPVVSIANASSCGTATAVSVPCIFSDLGRQNFEGETAGYRGNLLDVVEQAGYKVTWIDNNSGCQGVCKRVVEIDLTRFKNPELCPGATCYDGILVNALKEIAADPQDQFIVLHMLGSHGPSYYMRYPEEYKKFVPSCETSELSRCSREEVVNAYDNTIYYTDKVLKDVISYLGTMAAERDTAMVYVSDHGESLGENGIYLHSLPYFLAPQEQKQIPMIFWFSEGFRKQKLKGALAEPESELCTFSHDFVFSTMLDILDIETTEYEPDLDLLRIDTQLCKADRK